MTHGAAEPPGHHEPRPAGTVAVLGAGGAMGLAMARTIAQAGINVRACPPSL